MTADDSPGWLAYYCDLMLAIVTAAAGGAIAVVDHPDLADPLLRLSGIAFCWLFAVLSFAAARKDWCRIHGVEPLWMEYGEYHGVDPFDSEDNADDA
ncbi:hypothetical protein [Halostella litorea]|uniref:hypothetical protein n=1 Tax=Halostella litorea TaxID=2528831 RepID=UPI0010932AB0|nr:hypothetical protein [Halostella litorea]